MLERRTVTASFLIVCMLASAVAFTRGSSARAQSPNGQALKQAGAPLKGIDVKLGRYAGAQFGGGGMSVLAQATTDDAGKFTLPVVPAGRYVLTFELPKGPKGAALVGQMGGIQGQVGGLNSRAYVTLKLPGGRTVEKGYDFAQKKAFDPPAAGADAQASSRAKVELSDFVYESDGVSACSGIINTSRSNVKGQ